MAARTAIGAATRRRPRRKPWVKWLKRSILLFLTVFCLAFIGGAMVFAGAYKQAEQKLDNLATVMASLELEPTTFYSADGKVLYQVSNQYRQPVKYREIPEHVRNAIIAAEDKRFFKHHGVDLEALMAIARDAVKDKRLRGGSTLSMQLSKRLYTSNERSLERKVQDMALAVAMERRLTKEQILEMYMNEVFFGSGAYGIKAAAEVYFDKPLKKLTLSDAALLARCVRRPTVENPFNDLKRSMANRNLVLNIMLEEGLIDEKEYKKALDEKPRLNPRPPQTTARLLRAPFFVRHVEQVLKQDLPDIDFEAGGYKVYTTIDSKVQAAAEKAVRQVVRENRSNKVTTGAFVLMDTKGRILAQVGGVDFKKNEFNVITQGRRQPGSAFKVIIYSTAIAQGAVRKDGSVPNHRIYRVDPWSRKAWNPKNSNGRYGGHVSTWTAFTYSYNLPAIHTLEKVGASTVIDYAKNVFGIQSQLPAVPSLGLGVGEVMPIEMARALTVFASGGDRAEPMPITRIIGPDGQVVRAYQPRVTPGVLDPKVVNDMDELMRGVVTSGTGQRAKIIPNAHGKTGTTQENKDAWFIGYTDGLVGIAWIGNEQRINGVPTYLPMNSRVYGGTVAINIWIGAMKEAHPRFAIKIPKRDPNEAVATRAPFATEEDVRRARAQERERTEADELRPGETRPLTPDTSATSAPPATPEPTPDPVEEPSRNDEQPRQEPDDEDRPRREEPTPRPRPAPPAIEYADIEICADSHQIAGMYCPETVVRTYIKGQQPSRRCRTHGPR